MMSLHSMRRPGATALLCLIIATVGACTGIDRPKTELAKAEASIDQAERNGGQEYGALALESARDKLAAAQRAADNDDNEKALRLANEADVDAQLAQAQADRGNSEAALKEINETLDSLQQESVNRNTP